MNSLFASRRRALAALGGVALAAAVLAVPAASTDVLGQTAPDQNVVASVSVMGSLTPGVTARGSIRSRNAQDLWSFTIDDPARVTLRVTAVDRSLTPMVMLVRTDGSIIATATGNPATVDAEIAEAGTYTVVVLGANNTLGRYDITMQIE
jgi:hypothetical protein